MADDCLTEEADVAGQTRISSAERMEWRVLMAKFRAHVESYYRIDRGLGEFASYRRGLNADGYTDTEQQAIDDH